MLNTCPPELCSSFFFEETERNDTSKNLLPLRQGNTLCSGLGTFGKGRRKDWKKGPTKLVGVHESYPRLPLRKDIINIRKHVIKINTMRLHALVNVLARNISCVPRRLGRLPSPTRGISSRREKIIKTESTGSHLSYLIPCEGDLMGLISLINVCSAVP